MVSETTTPELQPTHKKDPELVQDHIDCGELHDTDFYWKTYRWEFMRRSPEYLKAYNELDEFLKIKDAELDNFPKHDYYYKLALTERASKVFGNRSRFGFYWGGKHLPDPNKSFDEAFKSENISLNFRESYSSSLTGSVLRIMIDFSEVNSIHEIKRLFLIDFEKSLKLIGKSKYKKKRTRKKIVYSIILQVGDLKREGLTHSQIAKIIFPGDFNVNRETANPESAIRKVGQYYQTYKDLVNGGYKDITSP